MCPQLLRQSKKQRRKQQKQIKTNLYDTTILNGHMAYRIDPTYSLNNLHRERRKRKQQRKHNRGKFRQPTP